jgi:hypothetical protein
MTGGKPIKRKRSPRPRRPRPPLRVAERVLADRPDQEKFDLEVEVRRVADGKGYIQAKLDNGEIDAATAAKLREQVEIDAKTGGRTGEPWLDAKLAEYELSWKVEGCAPPVEVYAYLHYVGDLPPQALKTIFAALEAQVPKMPKNKRRWYAVRYCRNYGHEHEQPPRKRLTWTEAFEEAGKICGVGPDMMRKSYEAYERGLPPERRHRTQRKKPG